MELTTLCYMEKDNSYLMLHRVKKEKDINKDKWIGIGGHFEEGESPEECVIREVYEETGLALNNVKFRGIITFVSDMWDNEFMFLYTSEDFSGTVKEVCDEGELAWIPKSKVIELPAWEGDKVFLKPLIDGETDIHIKLVYEGEKLVKVIQ